MMITMSRNKTDKLYKRCLRKNAENYSNERNMNLSTRSIAQCTP